jgi:hypothetical protein
MPYHLISSSHKFTSHSIAQAETEPISDRENATKSKCFDRNFDSNVIHENSDPRDEPDINKFQHFGHQFTVH